MRSAGIGLSPTRAIGDEVKGFEGVLENIAPNGAIFPPPGDDARINKITPELPPIFLTTCALVRGTARGLPKRALPEYSLRRMPGKNPEKVLNTFAVGPFDQEVNVVGRYGVVVDFDFKKRTSLSYRRHDDFSVLEEAPPTDRVVRFKRDMVGAFDAQGSPAPAFTDGEGTAVFLRIFL